MTTIAVEYKNAQDTDFSKEENVVALKSKIKETRNSLGKKYPYIINGEKKFSENELVSLNPANPNEVVGTVSKASQEEAERAIQSALQAFESWSRTPVAERADYLFKAAEALEKKRLELASVMILEAGKNYAEADAEVSEAIDFLNFYATSALKLAKDDHKLIRIPGEDNKMEYIPLGVGFIVPPWNFPFAICIGLTVSAVVTGNTVLLKPSSLTPVIAYKFMEVMEEVGLPKGVINFVPGDSSDIGDYITGHPQTRFISFTGSKAVGLHINALAAQTAPGQKWIKRVNAEMGGKDGVVVDETADLDFVAQEVVEAAFSFQGQKCSAGSRLIVVEEVYDELVEKVVAVTKKLSIGTGEENNQVGPVIDKKAYKSILNYIEIGKQEGKLELGGKALEGEGYFIEPTVISGVTRKDSIMQEEIFGPVLAIAKAKDWKDAIDIYNDTEYGLTGSFFSNVEARLDFAAEEMHCGNLYLNRRCTGALVGVHPFGGFNMSGTDSKAGSYDYIKLFSQAKTVTKRL
ncbi:L-glutamate gamma-semialdehyde dehydrogenase [Planomicrobium sp. CPCC 101079]|uniref:L-glutamate gamma-semialdehyde dehydrogenase n=1 Tax=Planomicrobium sp. CPCC 101079 TaxID=2599618 RepID=UPI0011B7F076|nr:L-glutamate gamma-semialdehyde dehydrogenase [Planomicrobium sp. CPCC 101079]TWT01552.1 L-glutamate gamma-semialdehyde dehydrogenase [Planomicrobium sp. CPCC 101079]